MKHIRARSKLFALGAAIVLATTGLAANADDIVHTVDSTAGSTISLEVDGDGSTKYWVDPTGTGKNPADGVQGCNLTGQTTLTVDIVSSDPAVATVSPSQVTFTSCVNEQNAIPVDVHAVGEGTATITLTQVSNTTAGTFNLAPATFTVVVSKPVVEEPKDTTAPTIAYVGQSPKANANGWNNTAVTLNWTCVDEEGGSGIDTEASTRSFTIDSEGENQSAKGICVDNAGNRSEDVQYGINIDLTAPEISYASQDPRANDAGWNNSAVTLTWNCSDRLSGVVAPTDQATISTEGWNQSADGTCVDKAGNSISRTDGDVNIDLTEPGIVWNGGPEGGSSHYFGFVPAAPTCTATDNLSGAKSCEVTGYGDTVGTHTMTATASDNADNVSTESRSYSVKAWTISGFKSPVDMAGAWNSVKGGSTVPLKFEVFAGETELTDTAVVASFKTSLVTCDLASQTAEPVNIETTGKTALRYDATDGQFIQNWQTAKNPGACYKVTMTTVDGSSVSALFKLK